MKRKKRPSHEQLLHCVPVRNDAMTLEPLPNQAALATVPLKRPRYLVPPLSWILPFSPVRRVELDATGTAVLDLCDGHRSVEEIAEQFARQRKLSFREALIPIAQFLHQLAQRGIIAVVGFEE